METLNLLTIHTNKLRSFGSKLVGITSPECPEHSQKLGSQLPRNNCCCPREYAWESEGVQLSAVWSTVPSFCTQQRVILRTPEHAQNP